MNFLMYSKSENEKSDESDKIRNVIQERLTNGLNVPFLGYNREYIGRVTDIVRMNSNTHKIYVDIENEEALRKITEDLNPYGAITPFENGKGLAGYEFFIDKDIENKTSMKFEFM